MKQDILRLTKVALLCVMAFGAGWFGHLSITDIWDHYTLYFAGFLGLVMFRNKLTYVRYSNRSLILQYALLMLGLTFRSDFAAHWRTYVIVPIILLGLERLASTPSVLTSTSLFSKSVWRKLQKMTSSWQIGFTFPSLLQLLH